MDNVGGSELEIKLLDNGPSRQAILLYSNFHITYMCKFHRRINDFPDKTCHPYGLQNRKSHRKTYRKITLILIPQKLYKLLILRVKNLYLYT